MFIVLVPSEYFKRTFCPLYSNFFFAVHAQKKNVKAETFLSLALLLHVCYSAPLLLWPGFDILQ